MKHAITVTDRVNILRQFSSADKWQFLWTVESLAPEGAAVSRS